MKSIKVSQPYIDKKVQREVARVLRGGQIAHGPQVKKLEQTVADYLGVKHVLAVSSGTSALHLALTSCDLKPGDEVITTPYTFIATVNMIIALGAKPVFVDIRPDTFNIDESLVEKAITSKTKAIVAVHLFGQACDMTELMKIGDKHGVAVVEDAAQSFGAKHAGKHVGSFGRVATFSLYATKPLSSAEGGLVTTNDDNVARRCRLLRAHGLEGIEPVAVGYNYRMSDIHAAIANAQLPSYSKLIAKRRKIAYMLSESLTDKVVKPSELPGNEHVWCEYVITLKNKKIRDKLLVYLKRREIYAQIFYPYAAHQLDYIREVSRFSKLPVADRATETSLALPIHQDLSKRDVKYIINSVNGFFGEK